MESTQKNGDHGKKRFVPVDEISPNTALSKKKLIKNLVSLSNKIIRKKRSCNVNNVNNVNKKNSSRLNIDCSSPECNVDSVVDSCIDSSVTDSSVDSSADSIDSSDSLNKFIVNDQELDEHSEGIEEVDTYTELDDVNCQHNVYMKFISNLTEEEKNTKYRHIIEQESFISDPLLIEIHNKGINCRENLQEVINKYNTIKHLSQTSEEYISSYTWIKKYLAVPQSYNDPFSTCEEILDEYIIDPETTATINRKENEINNAKNIMIKHVWGQEAAIETILDHLACIKSGCKNSNGSISFSGPPGVGKTTLGKLIAKILDRPFISISLSSITDVGQLTGSLQSWVGSGPGKLVQSLIKCDSLYPVILLDEIDKIPNGKNQDAILGVILALLEPHTSSKMEDGYFQGLTFDFSHCMFICTMNNIEDIHPALRSRLNNVVFKGFNMDDKVIIGTNIHAEKIAHEWGGIFTNQLYSLLSDKSLIQNIVLEDIVKFDSGVRMLINIMTIIAKSKVREWYCKAPSEGFNMSVDIKKIISRVECTSGNSVPNFMYT